MPPADQSPLVGANSIGFGRCKIGFHSQDVFQGSVTGFEEGLVVGGDQLDQNSVVVGNLSVQNTGLTTNHPLKFLHGDLVSLGHSLGANANHLVVVYVGGVAK